MTRRCQCVRFCCTTHPKYAPLSPPFRAECVRFCEHINLVHDLALPKKMGIFRNQRDATRHLLGQRAEVMEYGKSSKAYPKSKIKTLQKVKITRTVEGKQTTMPVAFFDRGSKLRCRRSAAALL